MNMPTRVSQSEGRPEVFGEGLGGVPCDRQAAALFWAIRRKRRNDGGPLHLEHGTKALPVSALILWRRQEVEHGAVVPDVTRLDGPLSRHVSFNPGGNIGGGAESLACPLERRA